jgi:perosamine synthetase
MVTAILDEKLGVQKPELIERLKEKGIDARPFFNPLSTLPAYQGVLPEPQPQNTVSLSLSPFGVNLPSALCLTQEHIYYIADSVTECLTSS